MTLQKQDILILEDLIRRVVREEIRNAIQDIGTEDRFPTNEEFQSSAA